MKPDRLMAQIIDLRAKLKAISSGLDGLRQTDHQRDCSYCPPMSSVCECGLFETNRLVDALKKLATVED